ncbi:hypothetical protein VC83_00040 [Pseudogymnoascus destructans]|uniref:A to I editase domain-containing protein n=2 Tax=Pseudogymnoascus destructans TaxID=655981 RepID=L8G4A2_PSED2|nr:uncharacterized protein VC83_00040 [Pseudogymnoascus destructans]ELR07977.1 hypothetical protein GMDG_02835 [Pseudogymnoascus destructans 20631-21]OAF63290.1 hypothetical protein VC83_00040 [Pseudogymnoascus destructans]
MELTGDSIAATVLKKFNALSKKRKPIQRADHRREWVPLAGIVAQGEDGLTCLALGTGMKCLPSNKIPEANGTVLHDWHAEVVALRSINRFLLEECRKIALSREQSSKYVRRRRADEIAPSNFQPFTIKEDVKLHMYCSEAPCGDASMELTMAAQDDATPWAIPAPASPTATDSSMPGRGYFSNLGIVRRKPSRPDAPSTLSKSCSDKITLKQITSVLSSITSLLISPENAYLKTLTLPESQYVAVGCERCFSPRGRLKDLQVPPSGGYSFQNFKMVTTKSEFAYSRRDADGSPLLSDAISPSNIAASWSPYFEETLIGGVLQGRKQNDPRGASVVCKKRMWELARDITRLLDLEDTSSVENSPSDEVESGAVKGHKTYEDMKQCQLLQDRMIAKNDAREALKGWVRNDGDEGFTLDE